MVAILIDGLMHFKGKISKTFWMKYSENITGFKESAKLFKNNHKIMLIETD